MSSRFSASTAGAANPRCRGVRETPSPSFNAPPPRCHAALPVVAATQGLALGGGCEFLMHCDRVVAALESLLSDWSRSGRADPGRRRLQGVRAAGHARSRGGDLLPFLRPYFEAMAMARFRSAEEARQLGYLRTADVIVFNPRELLYVAKTQARALAEAGYQPPQPRKIRVAGRASIAACQMMLVNMRDGGFISPHDYRLGLVSPTPCAAATSMPMRWWTKSGCSGWSRRFVELAQTHRPRPGSSTCSKPANRCKLIDRRSH